MGEAAAKTDSSSKTSEQEKAKIKALEAQAVDKAKATADKAFRPPASILNAASAEALITLADGPALDTYDAKESVYVGRSVPVGAGKTLAVPIQVAVPGSVVEYIVEIDTYDISISIQAERDEGITVVKEASRVTAVDSPLSQKFLVGTVPCMIKFEFSNDYSWMREKIISYRITVTPPTKESLLDSRRTRAATCLKTVQDDLKKQSPLLEKAEAAKVALEKEVQELTKALEAKTKALTTSAAEAKVLGDRKALRMEQERLLQSRLKEGWADEKAMNGKK